MQITKEWQWNLVAIICAPLQTQFSYHWYVAKCRNSIALRFNLFIFENATIKSSGHIRTTNEDFYQQLWRHHEVSANLIHQPQDTSCFAAVLMLTTFPTLLLEFSQCYNYFTQTNRVSSNITDCNNRKWESAIWIFQYIRGALLDIQQKYKHVREEWTERSEVWYCLWLHLIVKPVVDTSAHQHLNLDEA